MFMHFCSHFCSLHFCLLNYCVPQSVIWLYFIDYSWNTPLGLEGSNQTRLWHCFHTDLCVHFVEVHRWYKIYQHAGLKPKHKFPLKSTNLKYLTISPKSHSTLTLTELIDLLYTFISSVRGWLRNGDCTWTLRG